MTGKAGDGDEESSPMSCTRYSTGASSKLAGISTLAELSDSINPSHNDTPLESKKRNGAICQNAKLHNMLGE
jgi:hypothetical protein